MTSLKDVIETRIPKVFLNQNALLLLTLWRYKAQHRLQNLPKYNLRVPAGFTCCASLHAAAVKTS